MTPGDWSLLICPLMLFTWLACAGLGLAWFAAVDSLLRHVWSNYHEEWELLGRPWGFLFRPEGADVSLGGAFERQTAIRDLMRNPPEAMRDDPTFRQRVRMVRFTIWSVWICGALWIVLFVLAQVFGDSY